MRDSFHLVLGFGAAALLVAPDAAVGGGLVVPGAGPSAQPRAGAFVAKADDPTAIGHNPAGFAKLDGTQFTIGANFIDFALTYQRFGNYEASVDDVNPGDFEGLPYPEIRDKSRPSVGLGPFQLLPLLAVSTDLGNPDSPLRFGAGVFTPQGYTAREFDEFVAVEGADDFAPGPQRYDSIEQSAAVLQPSLIVAYKALPNLDVGLRASWGFGQIKGKKAVWGVRNYDESRGQDSAFTLDSATDRFVPGFSLGLLYRPSQSIEIGAAYNSKLTMHAAGSGSAEVGNSILEGAGTEPVPDELAKCEPGGVEGALKICFDLVIAQSASVGGRWIFRDSAGREQSDIELDVRWEDWSASKDNVITADGQEKLTGRALEVGLSRHGFRDVLSVRLGGQHRIGIAGHELTFKGGVAYDTAAAPDSWSRVDLDGKQRLTLGAGLAIRVGRYEVTIGGGLALQPTTEVAKCKAPGGPTPTDVGCAPGGGETPSDDREQPDPQQPLLGKKNQVESPFNDGRYESGYKIFSVGVTTRF